MWTYHPDSPFGDVDLCSHGCCRDHREDNVHPPICIDCDFPDDANIHLDYCPHCQSECEAQTWHLDDVCLKCKRPTK